MAEYERIKRLGAGNFGEVWLVFDQALAVQRAVKYIPPSRISDPTDFYKEPQTLMALRHDNIVEVQDAGKTQMALYMWQWNTYQKDRSIAYSTECRYL